MGMYSLLAGGAAALRASRQGCSTGHAKANRIAATLMLGSLLCVTPLAAAPFLNQAELVAADAIGNAQQGQSVALSADGNTAIVGGIGDNGAGAAWVFSRSGGVWAQQGSKLVGTGAVGASQQGTSVALSADGNTAIMGGPTDNPLGNFVTGAAWVFAQPVPSLQVTPTTNILVSGQQGGPFSPSSFQYTVSATRESVDFSISGVPNWLTPSLTSGSASAGTTVTFTVNTTANSLAVGTYGPTTITFTDSDTGQIAATVTATLTVNPPALQVTPATNIVTAGNPGGPFAPSSFQYQLSATVGSVNYSISGFPSWLTPSSTSGAASTERP
jgi:hypothetical protein